MNQDFQGKLYVYKLFILWTVRTLTHVSVPLDFKPLNNIKSQMAFFYSLVVTTPCCLLHAGLL